MKNLMTFILMIFSLTIFVQTEKKWVSESDSAKVEMIEFKSNNTLEMFIDEKELPTEKPIT